MIINDVKELIEESKGRPLDKIKLIFASCQLE